MSDHYSSPRAMQDSVVDITDMYVFPSPERPGSLVLVLCVFPFAGATARFSNVIDYRFRVRPVTIPSRGAGAAFAVGDKEYRFSCRFSAPADAQLAQEGICTAPNGEAVSFRVNDEGGGHGRGLRIWAGLRMDPFFTDGVATTRTVMTGKLSYTSPGECAIFHQNVLGIVVEFDVATMFESSDGPLFGVVGETALPGPISFRFEHFGRMEMKNVTMGPWQYDAVNRNADLRDLFNQEDGFNLGRAYLPAFRARLNANLAFYDGLDGKTDWPLDEQGTHPLTELLLADFTVVDVSKPFSEDSLLEIESAMLAGRQHATCGGRWPNEDTSDTWMTFMINAGKGPRISDGVDAPTVPASQTFPYLMPPEPNPKPRGLTPADQMPSTASDAAPGKK